MTEPLTRYLELLDALLWRRAVHGTLDDDEEEYYVEALNDCRQAMSPEDESKIAELVAKRRAVVASETLGLVDTEPPKKDDAPLRIPKTAA